MARKFYYDADGEKLGPVTGQELLYLRAEGKIDNNTWVRAEDSQTWRPFSSVNLKEEREKAASAGIWRQLFRNVSPGIMLVTGLVFFTLLVLVLVAAVHLWPFIFCGIFVLLAIKLLNMKW